mmetsp:Transcript_32720/g.76791  ORF Transcript_32720/g.76791 Transcript_32720/m.76791 type:complete len:178 (+) Transcript_32720:323-856(+)
MVTTAVLAATVVSGAFMAGNEAGIAFPEWPRMGGQWLPDWEDLWQPSLGWRNLTENITTVHLDHRMLAYTTLVCVDLVCLFGFLHRASLSPATRTALVTLFAGATAQASLGIATVLMSVPVDVAATHQAGSLALLTVAITLLHTLRAPRRSALSESGRCAAAWRSVLRHRRYRKGFH